MRWLLFGWTTSLTSHGDEARIFFPSAGCSHRLGAVPAADFRAGYFGQAALGSKLIMDAAGGWGTLGRRKALSACLWQ